MSEQCSAAGNPGQNKQQLPTQLAFITLGTEIDPLENAHPSCGICQEVWDVLSFRKIRKINECGHEFHGDCLFRWMESTHIQRNTCPICRRVLYQLNPLTAEQNAQVAAEQQEYYDAIEGLQRPLHDWLMANIDELFVRERNRGGEANYLGLLAELTTLYGTEYPGQFISDDHLDEGDEFLYQLIASRLREKLEENNVPRNTVEVRAILTMSDELDDGLPSHEPVDEAL
jgi:hypothetical protein